MLCLSPQAKLQNLYRSKGQPFKPTQVAKAQDSVGLVALQGVLDDGQCLCGPLGYSIPCLEPTVAAWMAEAKTPELLYEVNQLCGGAFAELVEEECDPQAIAVSLPSKMKAIAIAIWPWLWMTGGSCL